MTKIKNYNGVDIYVSSNGVFYCDPVNNSRDFWEKKFHSEKLASLEKALDNYGGAKIDDGLYYYSFTDGFAMITKLTVISKLGNRLFFNDGTNSASQSRKVLYPSSIESQPEFLEIKAGFEKMNEINSEINKLNLAKSSHRTICDAAKIKLEKL